jgi:hypothetical protein
MYVYFFLTRCFFLFHFLSSRPATRRTRSREKIFNFVSFQGCEKAAQTFQSFQDQAFLGIDPPLLHSNLNNANFDVYYVFICDFIKNFPVLHLLYWWLTSLVHIFGDIYRIRWRRNVVCSVDHLEQVRICIPTYSSLRVFQIPDVFPIVAIAKCQL